MAADRHGFELHEGADRGALLLTFGSLTNPGRTEPSFALMNTCLELQRSGGARFAVGYARARGNDWYRGGVAGLGADVTQAAAALREVAAPYARVVCAGNSMGGYAALVFGALIGAAQVVAFAPQTRLDAAFRARIGDRRWSPMIRALQEGGPTEDMGVADIWNARAPDLPRATLYLGAACAQDIAHAGELAGLPQVSSVRVAGTDHDVVHALRASGALRAILAAALAGEPDPPIEGAPLERENLRQL